MSMPSLKWVTRVILTVLQSLPVYPIGRHFQSRSALRICANRRYRAPKRQLQFKLRRSIKDGREVVPPRLAVLADRHECHRPDRAEALRQTPAKQPRASSRHEERDWLFRQPGRPKEQRLHILLRFGNTVIGQPDCWHHHVGPHTPVP